MLLGHISGPSAVSFYYVSLPELASLQGHIDDLKFLLSLHSHKFSTISNKETHIREIEEPLLKIDIEGYSFRG